jgi:D-tyrosyl-tRNA(Tyr) deacylase
MATDLRATGIPIETGVFAAHMQVVLVNDGPVTFALDSRDKPS